MNISREKLFHKVKVLKSVFGRWQFMFMHKVKVLKSIFGRWQFMVKLIISPVKERILGTHPNTNIFHPQFVMDYHLRKFAQRVLLELPPNSKILDVGCGNGPYWSLNDSLLWHGIDVYKTEATSYLVNADGSYPIPDLAYDFVLCTQVLEHVERIEQTVFEMNRVLKMGGVAFINMPFIYPFHGMPNDFSRLTTSGLLRFFSNFEVLEIGTLGGYGSSLVTLINNHWNYQANTRKLLKLFSLALWPFMIIFFAISNLLALWLDKYDLTESFPLNSFIIVKRIS